MLLHLLFPILLCTTPELLGERLMTTMGLSADSLIQALPRTDSTYATLGMLLVNQVALKETDNKKRKADSALYYLQLARQSCPTNPVINAYIQVATGLRANEDPTLKKLLGNTKERAYTAFATMDSIRLQNPENLAVLFLSAYMFRDASEKLDGYRDFRVTSYKTFQALHVLALEGQYNDFFTDDVYSALLLSLGILVHTLEAHAHADTLACQYIAQLHAHFPNSRAAADAHRKKIGCAK